MSSNTLATPQTTSSFDVNARFRSVMNELGLSPEDTGGTITFVGEDPIFPSVHRLGACIGIPIMAGAAGIADIWRQRSGRGQDLTLDLRKAIHGINPMYKFTPTINGYPYQLPYFLGNPMGFDLYRTKDGRFFLPTGAYPRLLNSMCTFLGCSPDKDSIATAVSKWDSCGTRRGGRRKGARVRRRAHARRVGQRTLRASSSPKSRWWKSSRSVTAIPSRSHRRHVRCQGLGCCRRPTSSPAT